MEQGNNSQNLHPGNHHLLKVPNLTNSATNLETKCSNSWAWGDISHANYTACICWWNYKFCLQDLNKEKRQNHYSLFADCCYSHGSKDINKIAMNVYVPLLSGPFPPKHCSSENGIYSLLNPWHAENQSSMQCLSAPLFHHGPMRHRQIIMEEGAVGNIRFWQLLSCQICLLQNSCFYLFSASVPLCCCQKYHLI